MAKTYSWYEVPDENTGEMKKYPDPLNPDGFPDDEKKESESEEETPDN